MPALPIPPFNPNALTNNAVVADASSGITEHINADQTASETIYVAGAPISNSNPLPIGHSSATQVVDPNGVLQAAVQTGIDGQPQIGIPAGAQQLGSAFSTTVAAAVTSTGSQAVTPAAMSGANRGAPWSIQVGSYLIIDATGNREVVRVTAVTGTTFTAIFTKTHTAGFAVAGEVLNQAKDCTVDPSTGAGMSASGTYYLNKNTQQWVPAASYQGDLGGASDAPTAAAYELNGATLDPERSAQGKFLNVARTIVSGGGAGSTSVTLDAAPVGLQPGEQINFSGGTQETVYTSNVYTAGANPVVLATPLVNTHANASSVTYDAQNFNGPSRGPVTLQGVGGGEPMVLADPQSAATGQYYYGQNAAWGDNQPGNSLPAETSMFQTGTNASGNPTYSPERMTSIIKIVNNQAVVAGTPISVWTPAAGKKFRIIGYVLALSVAGNILFKDGANLAGAQAASPSLLIPGLQANVGQISPPELPNGYLSTAANNQCWLDVSASGNISGMVFGTEE